MTNCDAATTHGTSSGIAADESHHYNNQRKKEGGVVRLFQLTPGFFL